MIGTIPAAAAGQTGASSEDARLRQACAQMEGIFLQQLFQALRASVPAGGVVDGGTGEQVFTGLMDEHLAVLASARLDRGLGAALYRAFRSIAEATPPVGPPQGSEAT